MITNQKRHSLSFSVRIPYACLHSQLHHPLTGRHNSSKSLFKFVMIPEAQPRALFHICMPCDSARQSNVLEFRGKLIN